MAKDKQNSSSRGRTPQWQPIERLNLIAYAISGMLESAQEQYPNLLAAQPRPYVLDDHTINRVISVYTTQQDDLWVFEEQLKRWKDQTLTAAQRQTVENLVGQLAELTSLIEKILSLAAELKERTIEKMLSRSDLEIGLEALMQFQSPPRPSGTPRKPKKA